MGLEAAVGTEPEEDVEAGALFLDTPDEALAQMEKMVR